MALYKNHAQRAVTRACVFALALAQVAALRSAAPPTTTPPAAAHHPMHGAEGSAEHVCIHDAKQRHARESVSAQSYRAHPWEVPPGALPQSRPGVGPGAGRARARRSGDGDAHTFQTLRVVVEDAAIASGSADAGKMCGYAGQSYTYEDGATTYRSTCTKDDVATTAKRNYLRHTILPKALKYFTQHLKVVPVDGALKVTPDCTWTIGGR